MEKNWFWAMVIFPVIISIFKTELGNLWKAGQIYRNRAFDKDGNPNTFDHVQVLNGATGEWVDVMIMYVFSFRSKIRGVRIVYSDGGMEPVTLLSWGVNFKKREPPINHVMELSHEANVKLRSISNEVAKGHLLR